MPAPVSDECRIVSLSWDRGHEDVVAIVRAASPSGMVISEVLDLCEVRGRRWICAEQILDIDDLEPDDPNRRLAVLRGSLARDASADPTDLEPLLQLLQDRDELIGVYTSRTGSDECLVGPVVAIGSDELVLAEVRPDAASTGDELRFRLDDVIAVDWGNDYLRALAQLVAAE